ncbi:putative RNA recognition motif domain, nucleotide-binding alpha-beta plait domain superfamily [Helianthus anomalus]
MAYIIGLPISLADEDLLQRKDYFGRYGKVTKVSLSRTAGGTVQQFVNDTCSVYITYSKEEEAVRCIQSVHGYVLDGRFLRQVHKLLSPVSLYYMYLINNHSVDI